MPDEKILLETDNIRIKFTIANVLIIGINVIIFIYHQSLQPSEANHLIFRYGVVPADITHGLNLYTLFTSMFLHNKLSFIITNMFFLFVFGGIIESLMSPLRYLCFYLLCGVGAAISHVFAHWGSAIPMIDSTGAMLGVLGACLICHPRAKIWGVPVAAITVILLLIQVKGVVTTIIGQNDYDGESAWFANSGGFIIGLVLVRFLKHQKQESSTKFQVKTIMKNISYKLLNFLVTSSPALIAIVLLYFIKLSTLWAVIIIFAFPFVAEFIFKNTIASYNGPFGESALALISFYLFCMLANITLLPFANLFLNILLVPAIATCGSALAFQILLWKKYKTINLGFFDVLIIVVTLYGFYISAGIGGSHKFGKDVNEKAPDYSIFQTVDSFGHKPLSSEYLQGKILVIDFWGTWCPYCLQQFPGLQEVYQKYSQNDDVKFIILNTGSESLEVAKMFIKTSSYSFPYYYDVKRAVTKSFGVKGIPCTVLIDKQGIIRVKHIGAGTASKEALVKGLTDRIEGLLKQ